MTGKSPSALLKVDQVAEMLNVSRRMVYDLSTAGDLPSVVIDCGRQRPTKRWRLVDVEAFIQTHLTRTER